MHSSAPREDACGDDAPLIPDHVRSVLQRTGIAPGDFSALFAPVRHAIRYLIAAFHHHDVEQGRKIFRVCLRHLSDADGYPIRPQDGNALRLLRIINTDCLMENRAQLNLRKFTQAQEDAQN